MDLSETFKKQQDLLKTEPWASIIGFVDRVNNAYPDTLLCDLHSVDLINGTAGIKITRLSTGKRMFISTDLAPSHESINAQTPSNNTLFLTPTELNLFGFSISADGKTTFNTISEERPLHSIEQNLLDDLPSFLEPKTGWKSTLEKS